MILNINQLRAFYSAAKYMNITKAAQELMVTPPAVSKQIKQLEETIEIRLIFRNGNSMRLTEPGENLFKRCQGIFEQIKETENYLVDISRAKSGVLKIGCPETPAKYFMPPLIAKFKKNYPGIRIVLDQGSSSDMIKSILDHKNELAVVRYRPEEKRIKVKIIATEELILIAAPKSKYIPTNEISVTQLSTIPLILPRYGAATRDVIREYLQKFKMTPIIAMESGNTDLIKQLVSQDDGVSFLVRSTVSEDLNKSKLRSINILAGPPTLEYGIGYLERRSLSPGAWAFLRLLDKYEDLIRSAQ